MAFSAGAGTALLPACGLAQGACGRLIYSLLKWVCPLRSPNDLVTNRLGVGGAFGVSLISLHAAAIRLSINACYALQHPPTASKPCGLSLQLAAAAAAMALPALPVSSSLAAAIAMTAVYGVLSLIGYAYFALWCFTPYLSAALGAGGAPPPCPPPASCPSCLFAERWCTWCRQIHRLPPPLHLPRESRHQRLCGLYSLHHRRHVGMHQRPGSHPVQLVSQVLAGWVAALARTGG